MKIDPFFLPVFRLTRMEITSNLGWLILLSLTLALYLFTPYFLAVEDSQSMMARNQGAIIVTWVAGLYSIALGGRFGHLQVSRGGNLFYRAAGSSDIARMMAISLACTTPLLFCGGLTFGLLVLSQWIWGKSLILSLLVILQFSLLFYLPFLACCFLAVGLGAKISSGAGVAGGLVLFLSGTFLPPLLSIVAGVGPAWMELAWAGLPHFYAMDWSPAAVYMWDPSSWVDFSRLFFYGLCWVAILFSLGAILFRLSSAHNE